MNSDRIVSNYKIVALFENFPMTMHKNILKKLGDDYDCKKIGTYVSPGNLGLSLGKIHCSIRKVSFSPRNLGHIF